MDTSSPNHPIKVSLWLQDRSGVSLVSADFEHEDGRSYDRLEGGRKQANRGHSRSDAVGVGRRPHSPGEYRCRFCYIAAHKNHVNLGFNYGSELPDPEGLLQGPGKLLRHTKMTEPGDLSRPALRRLLEVATAQRMPAKPSAHK